MVTTKKGQKLYHVIVIVKGLREQTAMTLVNVLAKEASQVKHVIHVLHISMVFIVLLAIVIQLEAQDNHAKKTMENAPVNMDIKE